MLKGTRRLILDTISELPYLIKSGHTRKNKWKIFFIYLKISIKLFTLHRLNKINEENIFGFKVSTFDYGALHFLFREIFISNNYYFKTKINKPIIFDCGANIGIATLFFKWLYPKSVIYAFEADPQTFNLLENNIKKNKLKDVYLYNVALLDEKGKTRFYVDKKNPGWLTMSILKDRLPKDKIIVDSNVLSSYIKNKNLDFLKMDIEGAEIKVFKDLSKTKKINNFKMMVIELHHKINGKSKFSQFISILEKENLRYNFEAKSFLGDEENNYQDILIRVFR